MTLMTPMTRTEVGLRSTLCVTLLAGMLAAASPAWAYRMIQNTSTGRVTSGARVTCDDPGGFTHWTTASISWYHNTAGQGSGKASALQAAMQAWNNVSGASYVLSYAGTTGAGFVTDSTNTIVWASGTSCGTGCLALTALVLQSGQVIVETDVVFNPSYTWRTDGSDYDTQAVATHELGHTLGIHHTELSSSPLPTMYAYYFGTAERSLESDDRAALQCAENRYPPGGGPPPSCKPDGSQCYFNSECCSGVCYPVPAGGGFRMCI